MFHVLPSRALLLIHDYSRPMTRPDWRKSKPIISTYRLYTRVQYLFNVRKNLHTIILHNIYQTDWYYAFYYIKYHGLSRHTNLNTTRVINMEGIEEAVYYYEHE